MRNVVDLSLFVFEHFVIVLGVLQSVCACVGVCEEIIHGIRAKGD